MRPLLCRVGDKPAREVFSRQAADSAIPSEQGKERMSHTCYHGSSTAVIEAGLMGSEAALVLSTVCYRRLCAIAARERCGERRDLTLQSTDVAHEVLGRFMARGKVSLDDRRGFYRRFARAVRNYLVDYARHKKAKKAGGGLQVLSFDEQQGVDGREEADLFLAVHSALERLAAVSERQARVAELRFFVGLSMREVAVALGVSIRTASGDLSAAKRWLASELGY